jgi:mannose-1-phosphate guanylyltransferase
MQAMILAAGLGTRLRPYSLIRPKPLFPVLNRPLLNILIDMLRAAGCERIVVNGHHLGAQIRQAVLGLPGVSFQNEPEILGTGGALRLALDRFDEIPVLVMNGDIYHTIDPAGLYRQHVNSGNSVTMALHDFPRFRSVSVADERIVSFQPPADRLGKDLLAFTGIHVVEPEVIGRIPEGRNYHIIDLYERLAGMKNGIGYVRVDGCFWRDIGTPADYLRLHGELLGGPAEKKPVDAASGRWLIHAGAWIADDAVLTGWGCIGSGASVGSGAHLQNCVVWDNAAVAAGTRWKDSIITS